MSHIQFVDELVREYLIFRGFTGTAKAFDSDLKVDKDKGFRVDRIVDQLLQSVYTYDLNGLRESWAHLDSKLFIRLEQHFSPAIRKLENGLLKYYLVNAAENNKQDKITEFFTKLTSELLGQNEWKDWFVLPFVKNPEEHTTFAVCFTRQWQDTLIVSLHNFLAAVYQHMPQPTLSSFEENLAKISDLQSENEIMRKGIANLLNRDEKNCDKPPEEEMDVLLDDFYFIYQEVKANETQTKMLKTIMKNIGSLPLSPKIDMKPVDHCSRTSHRMFPVQRLPQTKRSLSIDRSGSMKIRERDSSLDLCTGRSGRDLNDRRESEKGQDKNFLFLSQEEYGEHKSRITSIKINNRGNLVASADMDGNLKVWSISTSCKTGASHSIKFSILCLEWLPNHERYIIYGTSNSVIALFDIKDLKLMWEINIESDNNKAKIDDIICNPVDSSVLVISDKKLFLLDLKSRKIERTFGNTGEVTSAKVNHNGQLVVVGTSEGNALLLDFRKSEVIEKWEMHSGPIFQIEFTADYTSIYTFGDDNKICWKSLNHAKGRTSILIVPEEVRSLNSNGKIFTVDSKGKYLLTVGTNSGVIYKMSDIGLYKCLELGGHKTNVACLDWSFANQCATCVTASHDGKIKVSTLLVDAV